MLLTILLAKVFGLYMVIGGLALLLRKRFIMSVLNAFLEEKAARVMIGAIDLILGLLIVNLHNEWATFPTTLITLIGWVALAKGVIALFATDAQLEKFIKRFREGKWSVIEGVIAVLLGAYLAAYGFGLF
jgi:hypothetical protein